MDTINEILDYKLINIGQYILTVNTLLTVLFIIITTKFIIWLIKKGLYKAQKFKKLDHGSLLALYQIIRYILWIVAISVILERIGIKITVLLTGSAALLVGVGIGIQQTFNDFISGIILLAEGSTRVGDILEVDGDIIKIQKIGLRTSQGIKRDDIVVIIPNSKIINNQVINWTHKSKKTRFGIKVSVAYGSDIELVSKLLIESVLEQKTIIDKTKTEARLVDFGNSSLDFELLFFSRDIFRIEKVKSDIRKTINQKFNENNITIPFPQMDIHLNTKK
jgi:small-conductance mechanosensitive channel